MAAFTSLDLLYMIVNIVEVLILSVLTIFGTVCGWLTWKDWQRNRRRRETTSPPSNVTVTREPRPFDWQRDGAA